MHLFCAYLRTDSQFALYNIQWFVFITEMASVYCAVRTGSLNERLRFVLQGLITTEATNFMGVLVILMTGALMLQATCTASKATETVLDRRTSCIFDSKTIHVACRVGR